MQQVIVYTKNNCPACSRLKAWLDGNEIQYDARNIEEKPEWKEEHAKLEINAAPILVLKNEDYRDITFIGFNPTDLAQLFNI